VTAEEGGEEETEEGERPQACGDDAGGWHGDEYDGPPCNESAVEYGKARDGTRRHSLDGEDGGPPMAEPDAEDSSLRDTVFGTVVAMSKSENEAFEVDKKVGLQIPCTFIIMHQFLDVTDVVCRY
jgi:hypothetical protein